MLICKSLEFCFDVTISSQRCRYQVEKQVQLVIRVGDLCWATTPVIRLTSLHYESFRKFEVDDKRLFTKIAKALVPDARIVSKQTDMIVSKSILHCTYHCSNSLLEFQYQVTITRFHVQCLKYRISKFMWFFKKKGWNRTKR